MGCVLSCTSYYWLLRTRDAGKRQVVSIQGLNQSRGIWTAKLPCIPFNSIFSNPRRFFSYALTYGIVLPPAIASYYTT
jgi:hypothetical protein